MLLAYGGSYMVRSVRGRYDPGAIGLNGVKVYVWAPEGFVNEFRWNQRLLRIYYPLYTLDSRFWHTSDKARHGVYPINEVAQEDIGKVYRAWK